MTSSPRWFICRVGGFGGAKRSAKRLEVSVDGGDCGITTGAREARGDGARAGFAAAGAGAALASGLGLGSVIFTTGVLVNAFAAGRCGACAAGLWGAAWAVVFLAGAFLAGTLAAGLAAALLRAAGLAGVRGAGRAADLAPAALFFVAGFGARAGGDDAFYLVAGLAGWALAAVILLTGLSSQRLDFGSAGGSGVSVAGSSAAHCSHLARRHKTEESLRRDSPRAPA